MSLYDIAQLPLVSCLMVTQRKRADLAKRAAACFRAQTYPARELVVVTDDPAGARELGAACVVEALPGIVLGDLRNQSLAHARGEYVAQWDDDDWYHPERLEAQILRLEQHETADACLLERISLAWPARDLFVTGPRNRAWECSLVAYRWRMPAYPALARGEDTPVVAALKNVTLLDRPELYVRHIHGDNTWDEAHFAPALRWPALAAEQVEEIRRYLAV